MKFWVTQDRLVVDTATVELRGGLQDAAEGTVTASAGSLSSTTSPEADGSWRVSVPLEIGVNEITVAATDGAGMTTSWTGTVVRLITDRVQADLDAVRAILARLNAGTGSAADLAAIHGPTQRGGYNYTDLNRVSAAAELVYQSLVGQGISVDYARVEVSSITVGRLPTGYTELEYIQSSGSQYINTGVLASNHVDVIADMDVQNDSPQYSAIFGCHETNLMFFLFFYDGYGGNGAWTADYITDRYIVGGKKTGRTTYALNGGEAAIVAGQSIVLPATPFQGSFPLFIFAINREGILSNGCAAKLFSMQIYAEDVLVRDFVPCQNPSGNVGLYDLVGGQFYGNAGSGAFTSGPEVPDPPPVIDYAWQETDTPTASQMAQYLANVANLLGARLVQQPYITLPASMAGLTLAGANNIEWALVCVDAVTPVARKSYIYSGEAMAGEF